MDAAVEAVENAEKRDWAELTHVCLLNILSRVSVDERWKGAMFVCKSWFEASKDPSLFSRFDLQHLFDSVRESSLWWTPDFEIKIDSTLRSVALWSQGQLKEIAVRHCSDRSLNLVSEMCQNLEVLSIKSCPNVTDRSMTMIALGCRMLRELDISFCYEVSYEALKLIGSNCVNLKVFKRNLLNWLDPSEHMGVVPTEYQNACPQDGNREASVIAIYMRNLVHLELRYSKMSSNGLDLIAQGCRSLEFLDLFGCANLTSRSIEQAAANMENLKTLVRPNFYIPRSLFPMERYNHWRLYDDRFQANSLFQI